jgi:CRP-like cAMP-binding protein
MEGKFGNEMYFVISGEVEVSVGGERLGFLGAEQNKRLFSRCHFILDIL